VTQVYEVFTKLSMVNGVSPVLAVLSKELLSLEGSINRLQAAFNGINRTSIAVAGGLAAFGGAAVLTAFKNVADHGDKLLDQQFKLRNLGVQQNEVLKLQAQYYKEVAKAVPTSSIDEYLKVVRELRAVTGSGPGGLAAAAKLAPQAMMMNELLGNEMGTKAGDEYYKLLRSAEMKGIATDPARRESFINEAYKYIAGFGGKLTANDYQVLARRGGTAWMNAKPEALGAISVLAADLGGSQAGTTLMTLQQLQTGANTLSKQQGAVLEELGLLDMSKVTKTGFGGSRLQMKPGAIKGAVEYSGNLPGWIQDVIYPALVKGSGGNEGMLQALIAKISPNRNAAKLIKMFGDEGFLDQIAKDMGVAGGVLPLKRGYGDYVNNDSVGVKKAFNAQYESMMQSIGAPMMQAAIPVMQGVTDLFTKIGNFANQHPETIEKIGKGMMVLGGALVGAGAAAILAALGPAGWIGMGLGAIGTAVALIPKDVWTGLGNGLSLIGKKADELLAILQSWGERFGGWLDGLRTKLMNALGGLWNSFTSLFSKTSYGGQGDGGGGNAGGMFNGASVIRAATDPVANAASMIGAHERVNNADVQEYLRTGGVGMNPAKTAWCAAFVNASLAKAGIKGTGSAAALSFLNWGSAVNGDAHRGDIFVKNHGNGHGHVGMLTGRFRDGLAEMISGNYGNRVGTSWENLRGGFLRRAFTPPSRGAGAHEQIVLNVDGETLGRVASKYIARHHQHTRQAPYFNGRGMFASNDVQFAVG